LGALKLVNYIHCQGTLPDGQEIAVKRLWRRSGQDAEQFKNEVLVAAKLQHKNLAKLMGFCLGGEDRMLIYEFVSNKRLDNFLYGLSI
jgi:serine/threonine protein kinase